MIKIYIFGFEVSEKRRVYSLNYYFNVIKRLLNSWPTVRIIMKNTIQYFSKTPVAICFNIFEILGFNIFQLRRSLNIFHIDFNVIR